jgi:hypothetical protein
MKEKEILKETHRETKPVSSEKPKKKYYKPRKKKEERLSIEVDNSEKPFVSADNAFKLPKTVGKYCMGTGKGFCIHLEKKPNWLHRKCMKLFLGWTWSDNK